MAVKERMKKKKAIAAMLLFSMFVLAGCVNKEDPLEKIKDLEFTVIAEENIPEEFLQAISEKKAEGIKMTYQDSGFLYICIGYGQQETGGYSIAVNALFETNNAVYFDTTLLGPQPGEEDGKRSGPSYPYVVIKTEFIDKPVVFE